MKKEARLYNVGKIVSSTNGAGKTRQSHEKNEIRAFFNTKTKTSSKWIKDLNVRPDTTKFLEKNKGRTLSDINCSNIFIHLPEMEIKTKTNKWDSLKSKNFFIAKETIKKIKRQITDWGKNYL